MTLAWAALSTLPGMLKVIESASGVKAASCSAARKEHVPTSMIEQTPFGVSLSSGASEVVFTTNTAAFAGMAEPSTNMPATVKRASASDVRRRTMKSPDSQLYACQGRTK